MVAYHGDDDDGGDLYEVQVMVNHHVFYRWPISAEVELEIRRYPGVLDRVVAAKLFGMTHDG